MKEFLSYTKNDPKFASLTYEEQQKTTMEAAALLLPKDNRFTSLSPGAQQHTIRAITSRPPVFRNRELGAKLTQVAIEFAKADKTEALKEAQKISIFGKEINMPKWMQGMTGNTPGTEVPSDEYINGLKLIASSAASNELTLFNLLTDKANLKVEDRYAINSYLASPEARADIKKTKSWMFELTKRDPEKAKAAALLQTTGQISGFGADLVSFYAATGWGGPSRAYAAAMKNYGKTAGMIGSHFARISPTFFRATASGITGITRSFTEALTQPKDRQEAELAKAGENIGKSFGEFAVIDYAIGAIQHAGWPLVKLLTRGTLAGLFGKSIDEFAGVARTAGWKDPKIFKADVDNFLRGSMDPVHFNGLPQHQRDFLTMKKNVSLWWTGPDAALAAERDPIRKITLMANNMGATVVQDGSVYRFYPKKASAAKTFNTLDDVYEAVGIQAQIQYSMLKTAAEKKAFLASYGGTSNAYFSGRFIDMMGEVPEVSKDIPEYAETVKKIKANLKAKRYIPINMRKDIHPSEAQRIVKEFGSPGVSNNNVVKGKFIDGLFIPDEAGEQVIFSMHTASPAVVDDIIKQTDDAMRINKNLAATATADDVVRIKLKDLGYDAYALPDGKIKTFYPETAIKNLNVDIDPLTGKKAFSAVFTAKTPNKDGYIVAKATKSFEQISKNPEEKIKLFAHTFAGKTKPDRIKRNISKLLDINEDLITVEKGPSILAHSTPEGKLRFVLPDEIATRDDLRKIIKSLAETLDYKPIGRWEKIKYLDAKLKKSLNIYDFPFENKEMANKWVQSLIDNQEVKIFKQNGKYYYKNKPYTKIDDITSQLMKERISPQQFKIDMYDAGYNYVKIGGKHQLREGNKIVHTAKSFDELLTATEYTPKRIDSLYGPQAAYLADGEAGFNVYEKAVFGTRTKLVKYLDSFEDYTAEAQKTVKLTQGDNVIKQYGKSFEVYIPEIGERKTFSSYTEAKKFITESDWQDFSELKKISYGRGYRAAYSNGQFIIHNGDGVLRFDTADEVKAFLAANPVPKYAPEIAGNGLYDEIEALIKTKEIPTDWEGRGFEKFDPYEFQEMTDITFMQKLNQSIAPQGDWILDAARTTKHEPLVKLFKHQQELQMIAKTEIAEGNKIINKIYTGANGKQISTKRKIGIFHYITAKEKVIKAQRIANKAAGADGAVALADVPSIEAVRLKVMKDYGLGEEDLRIIKDIRHFLGENQYQGLHNKFGIDNLKFLEDYLPRIREYVDVTGDIRVLQGADMDDVLKHSLGEMNYQGKEIRFWAENARLDEITNMAREENSMKLLMKYNSQGHKRLYLSETWSEINQYIAKNKKYIPTELQTRLNIYRDELYGIFQTDGQRAMKSLGITMFKKLGMKGETAIKAGSSVLDTFYGLNYLSTMGWRPYQSIRNIFQVYTTLGARFGNSYVNDALQLVAKAPAERLAYYKALGIITDVPPLVNRLVNTDSKLSKLVNYALGGFKNSDEVTRAIAAEVGNLRLDEALGKLKNGVLKNMDEFAEFSAVNLVDDTIQQQIFRLVEKADPDSIARAKFLYAKEIVNETMFDYSKMNSPYKGLIGKAFGQYGTYAGGYRNNILRGVTRGTKAQKAAYVARFLGNSTALYYAFKAAGIRAENFLPWTPAIFTGGPAWQLGIDALESMGEGYEANAARNRLLKQLSPIAKREGQWGPNLPQGITPAYYQLRGLKRFLEYSEAGDPWKAFLSLTSAPIRDDWED